jgi:hypothetical protein
VLKIGFNLPRDNIIRLYSPFIDYLLANGCEIYIFCDHSQKPSEMGYKASMFPALEKIPVFKNESKLFTFENVEELAEIIKSEKIQIIFSVNFTGCMKRLRELLENSQYSLIFAELQYFLELLIFGNDLSKTDAVYLFSQNWLKWWKEYILNHSTVPVQDRAELFGQIDQKSVITGFPEADQVKDFDKSEIRKKYNIAADKKVVVLMPFPWAKHRFPLISWSSFWTEIIYKPNNVFIKLAKLVRYKAWRFLPEIWRGVDDLDVMKAIRAFCDKNNAVLVVKGREKNPIPSYIRKMADYVFIDKSFYPFTTLELMYIADLSIGYWTMGIIESVMAGAPSICLVPKKGHIWPECEDNDFGEEFTAKDSGFYNFENVVYNEDVTEFSSNFGQKTFADYKICCQDREKFIEKFLGYSDFNACERIYKDLCGRLKQQ